MSNEAWAPVRGYEGIYAVSNHGLVRREAGGQGARSGKILRATSTGSGYLSVCLYKNRVVRRRLVHRLVTAAFIGPCPEGLEVNHKNADKTDNRLGNLEYVDRSTNYWHAAKRGLISQDDSWRPAKLTPTSAREIRRLYASGRITQRSLAERFGVSVSAIADVLARKSWRNA